MKKFSALCLAALLLTCSFSYASADAVSDLTLPEFLFRYAARAGARGTTFTMDPVIVSGFCVVEDTCIVQYDEESMGITTIWIAVDTDNIENMCLFMGAAEISLIQDNLNGNSSDYVIREMGQLIVDTTTNFTNGQTYTHYDKFDFTLKTGEDETVWLVASAA